MVAPVPDRGEGLGAFLPTRCATLMSRLERRFALFRGRPHEACKLTGRDHAVHIGGAPEGSISPWEMTERVIGPTFSGPLAGDQTW